MNVKDLVEKLKNAPPDATVVFDTEAGSFDCHLVDIDSAEYEEDDNEVILYSDVARRY